MANGKKANNIRKIYPGRPKRCDNVPGEYACKKAQKNGCQLCIHCRSLER